MKRTSKRLLALLLVLTMAIGVMPFAALSAGAVESAANKGLVGGEKTIKFVIGNEIIDAYSTGTQSCTVVVPKATDAVCSDNMFGWYGVLTNGDTTKTMLIKVDDEVTFQQGDVAVFKPLTLDIRQVSDPMLRMKNDEIAGLRFLSAVSKVGYQGLLDMIANGLFANAELTLGTRITTPDGVKDVPFAMALNSEGEFTWYQETKDLGYIAGTIWDADIAVNSAAIIATGYAKLTLNGEDYYAYAKNDNKKATSIYELAIDALNKVSTEQGTDYKLQIDKNLYAPYTVSERAALRSFVDNVVSLKTSAGGDVVELIEYAHYNPNSKWQVAVATEDDSIWSTVMEKLDNPDDVAAVSMLVAKDASASVAGGILLDGIALEVEAIEYEGSVYYLVGGFADNSPHY